MRYCPHACDPSQDKRHVLRTAAAIRLTRVSQTSVSSPPRTPADGIVLIYHHQAPYAATVMEHVHSFAEYSNLPVWEVNVDFGFPPALRSLEPRVIVLHYSLFGAEHYQLPEAFREWLRAADGSYRIAFFQDEHQHVRQRFEFIDDHRIDCIYSLVDPEYHAAVYGVHTRVPRIIYTLTGYVSDELVRVAAAKALPDAQRRIDIGYRSRSLPWYQGRGAQEKSRIGVEFLERTAGSDLVVDIAMDEDSRLYGDAWTDFLANSRAFIGVEAGVSIFDLTGEVKAEFDALLADHPNMSFEEVDERLLARHEGNIPYRTVSPRHFEAAAFRVVQILFEGRYSGVLEPMRHYIPLKKDFSNFDEVLALFRDPGVRRTLTDNAHVDLIESGRYSYRSFIRSFDDDLAAVGILPGDRSQAAAIGRRLRGGTLVGRAKAIGRPYYRRALPHSVRVRARAALDRLRQL